MENLPTEYTVVKTFRKKWTQCNGSCRCKYRNLDMYFVIPSSFFDRLVNRITNTPLNIFCKKCLEEFSNSFKDGETR